MNTMDYIGIAVVALHGIVIFSIILWFGLAKPKTWAEFRLRFLRDFFGIRSKTAPRT